MVNFSAIEAPSGGQHSGYRTQRSHLTDKLEFSQLFEYTGDVNLAKKLATWEESSNVHRPHGGLGGFAQHEVLKEKITS